MQQPHDRSYHKLFSHPELLEDLVRNFVDEPWVDTLDFARMEQVNSKFIADSLERRDSDLILRIPFLQQDNAVYLLLLLEFQSTVDPWMVLRFGTYVHLLYQELLTKQQLIDGKLPPVFPLLLYNGDYIWKAATELKSLIALPPNTPLWKYQPAMQYYLLDENRYPDGKAGSLSGLLFKMENTADATKFVAAIHELADHLPPQLASLKRAFIVWIAHVAAPLKGIKLEPHDIEQLEDLGMLATHIQQWEVNAQAKGFAKGIEKGIEKGVAKGEALLLLKMLTRKFGILPNWAQQKIDNASANEVEKWADRIFECDRLEAVFEGE